MADEVPEALRARAMRPNLVFGEGLLEPATARLGRYAVTTMPEPWALVERQLSHPPAAVVQVESMDLDVVERLEQGLPPLDAVVGLGGGSSLDMAKYVAWKRGIPLLLAPSVISVDACVSNTAAVRDGHGVKYVGFVVADAVLVDHGLIRQGPPRLNRAGIGDLLSIHTALWDWRAGERAGKARVDEGIAAEAAGILDELERHADEVRRGSDLAQRVIVEAYARTNTLLLQAGTAQPEEGSEHYWAYNVERITRRHYVHGELICLGVWLMGSLQQNDPGRGRRIAAAAGVDWQPRDLGISRVELEQSLLGLRRFVQEDGLLYSVIDEREITPDVVARLLESLRF